jgi:hypothetical protein
MKTYYILIILTVVSLLSFPAKNFAQAPNLRSTVNFVLFTITGAVDNTGYSPITGNIGTNDGDITGFNNVNGQIHNANAVTSQCSTDLLLAYADLNNTTATMTTHTPAYGDGETLFAGVYSIAAAGSVAGALTLDGQGNSNAVFIFKFGGAFTTAASSTIYMTNGTSACNVFWVAEGAISMAASTVMKGTLISHNGAISMGTTGSLEGRMFSTTGAVSVYNLMAPSPPCSVLPVKLTSFSGACDKQKMVLKWTTATELNNKYFTIEQRDETFNWQVIGRVEGAGNSTSLQTYSFTAVQPDKALLFYRLKQTDFDGNYKYSEVITGKQCRNEPAESITLYPNPSSGAFSVSFAGDQRQVYLTQIFNSQGLKIYETTVLQPRVDLTAKSPGVYFVYFHLLSKTICRKITVSR